MRPSQYNSKLSLCLNEKLCENIQWSFPLITSLQLSRSFDGSPFLWCHFWIIRQVNQHFSFGHQKCSRGYGFGKIQQWRTNCLPLQLGYSGGPLVRHNSSFSVSFLAVTSVLATNMSRICCNGHTIPGQLSYPLSKLE